MSARTTRSATESNSVCSRLMITRRAPLRFAISGKPAAGHTRAPHRQMAAAGPRGGEVLLHGKAPPPRLVARVLARDELIERDRLVRRPNPARRTEIRDAAFGRDAGSGERQHQPGVVKK